MKCIRDLMGQIPIWLQAARPKTLPASATPVLAGAALAIEAGRFNLSLTLCCLLFAVFAQIASNLANDGFDFAHGIDDEARTGPERAAASGKLTSRALFIGAIVSLGIGGFFGLLLLRVAPLSILWVGLACAVFVFLYSAGPKPLSHIGLGDILVILFFGIVPVGFTAYVQTGVWDVSWYIIGIAFGLVIDNILIVNNYRDMETDRVHGKYTVIVLFGRTFGRWFYMGNAVLALAIIAWFFAQNERGIWHYLLLGLWFLRHLMVWVTLVRRSGEALNPVLAETAKNASFLAVVLLIAVVT